MSFKSSLINACASLFITCVGVLTAVSILGVWKVLERDVITKSFETLGLLAAVAVIVVIAGRFIGDPAAPTDVVVPHPAFHSLRNLTLTLLIVSSALLALLGVLSIWDVITDKAVLGKSLASLAILAFSSLVIVMVCLEREGSRLWEQRGRQISGGAVVAFIILVWILLTYAAHF